MDLSQKKVLVTGAGGFVGSHLVERLLDEGCEVRCFIRYTSRNDIGYLADLDIEKSKAIDIVAGDLRDASAVRQAMHDIDVVFHLGALIAIPYSYVHPVEVTQTNVMGTLNVLMAARDIGVEKVVHTSTSEVYGTALYVPIDENHPLQGQSPYSASKIGADKLAESFYNAYDLPIATIRPFNIYGPRQSSRAVIPTIITQVLSNQPVHIGNTAPTRDYTYVTDTVDAFVKIAASDEALGMTINIGSNFEISIGNLINKIIEVTGLNKEIIYDPQRVRPANSEVDRLWADNAIACNVLEWEPKVQLEEGLKKTIQWIEMNMKCYRSGEYVI